MDIDWAAADGMIFSIFGEAATYRAGGVGDGTSVTVVTERPTADAQALGATLRASATLVHVRVSEAPNLQKGDSFQIGLEVLTVRAAPKRDPQGFMWTAEC